MHCATIIRLGRLSIPVDTRLCPKDLKSVLTELLEVGADWYEFGLALDLTSGILDTMKGPSKEPKSCIMDMLKHWLKSSPDPSWEGVVAALRHPIVSNEALAKRLEDKYCTPASELPTGDFYVLVRFNIRLLILAHN